MKQIADYALLEKMGDGNHGAFYLARTPARLGIEDPFCAIKILGVQATQNAFRRMANELQLFAAASSPHLIQLFDAGHQSGILYYAMAYHHRGSLAGERNTTRPREVIVKAVADAARGAHALHEIGVAHRDIKPSNVLLTDDGAVLGDLGLAQLLTPGSTMTGMGPIGALTFMEPGLARGDDAGRASDVWSLGATLLVALTGQGPFPGLPTTNLLQALKHLIGEEPSVPDSLDPTLRDVVSSCFAADRSDRPATALEFAEALEGAAAGV